MPSEIGSDPGRAPGVGECVQCVRLSAGLREARERMAQLVAERDALQEELLSAGEMIETLAQDLERPVR